MPETIPVKDLIRQAAKAAQVPVEVALAVAEQESEFFPGALGKPIPEGPAKGQRAIGVFQLLPSTAAQYAVDPFDPEQNIQGGIRYLADLFEKHQGNTDAVLREYGGVVRNQTYVPQVSARIQRYLQEADPQAPPAAAAAVPAATSQGMPLPPSAPAGTRAPSSSVLQPGPPAALQVARTTLPMAGAVIGGAKGALLGAPAGPIGAALGGVAGAGLGAFGGEAAMVGIEELARRLGFLQQGAIRPSGAISRVASAAETGMMGEMLGRAGIQVLTPIANRIAAPLAPKLSTYAREALAAFPPEKRALLPAEVSESRLLNIAENVAEGSIFGGTRIATARANRQVLAEGRVMDLLKSLGESTTPREAGVGAKSARQLALQQFRAQERVAWKGFEQLAAETPLTTPHTDAVIQGVNMTRGNILPNAGATAVRQVAQLAKGELETPIVGGSATAFAELPASVQAAVLRATQAESGSARLTIPEFHRAVSDIGKLVGSLESAAKTDPVRFNAQLGLAKRLYTAARADLETSLAANPPALEQFQQATTLSRLGNERLMNDEVRRILGVGRQHPALPTARRLGVPPEQLVSTLVRPNNSRAIEFVADAIGEPAMQPLRRLALEQIVEVDSRTGQISWPRVNARLQSLGPDTLGALFPEGQAGDLSRLTRLMLNIAHRPATGIGKVGIMLTQWGPLAGAGSAIAAGQLPAGMGILITPALLARVMASPTGLKWLTTGLEAPLGSAEAIRAAVHVTRFLQREAETEQRPSPAPSPARSASTTPATTTTAP